MSDDAKSASGQFHAIMQELGYLRAQQGALETAILQGERRANERMDLLKESLSQQITQQGVHISQQISGLGARVTALEQEDKRLIERVARMSVIGGSVSASLIAGAIELIKHIGK